VLVGAIWHSKRQRAEELVGSEEQPPPSSPKAAAISTEAS
jgi:hypothetical protein